MSVIKKAISELKIGRPVVLIDDETRENEGDLIFPSQLMTPEVIAFMMNECRGLICITITEERRTELGLALQVVHNESVFGTNFAAPFDFTDVQSIGVTAAGRARTIIEASKTSVEKANFVSPGFVIPVVARDGGVLRRRGQTEGSIDLVKLAGFYESAVICEILDEEGEVIRDLALLDFCKKHNFHICSIEDLVQYRRRFETNIRLVTTRLITQDVPIRSHLVDILSKYNKLIKIKVNVFVDDVDNSEHVALCFGDVNKEMKPVLCRIHSECLTGDVFGSLRCDCGPQLDLALEKIAENGSGVLIYLQQEGRGIGLANKIKAYELQEQGRDTFEANEELGFLADARDYRVAAQILMLLNVLNVNLLTNNPQKLKSLQESGIKVSERVPLQVPANPQNENYLRVKASKMGHLMNF